MARVLLSVLAGEAPLATAPLGQLSTWHLPAFVESSLGLALFPLCIFFLSPIFFLA